MAERKDIIPVLNHHKKIVEEDFPGITDIGQAEKAVRTSWIPYLQGVHFFTGELLYPKLANGERINLFVQNTARVIVAVNTGNYEAIPEWDPSNRRNADLICHACGNLVPSAAFPDGVMCKGLQRMSALSSLLRSQQECHFEKIEINRCKNEEYKHNKEPERYHSIREAIRSSENYNYDKVECRNNLHDRKKR